MSPRRTTGRQILRSAALVIAVGVFGVLPTACGGDDTGELGSSAPRPDDWPAAPAEEWTVPLGSPPVVTSGSGPFRFVATQADGTSPVAWDPCRPIHYVVNPKDGPADGNELVEDAVARTAAATGLTFSYDGTTDEHWTRTRDRFQPDRYGDRWAPVLITWAHESAAPVLAGSVAGQGGSSAVRPPGSEDFVFVSGSIVLDASLAETALTEPGRTAVRALIQHELGHVVGLDHVDDPTQLMHTESLPEQNTDWGPGDLEGLSLLGGGDCFPDV